MDFLHNIFRFFPLKSINTTTIQKIEEMLQLCLAKQERRGYDFLMEKCIFHRLGENLDVNVQVQSVIDWCISENKTWGEFIYEYEHEEARKLFFAFYHEILRRVKTNPPNKKYLEDLPMWIFNTMIQFNKRKKKEQILLSEISDLVPMLIAIIKKSTKNILEDFEFTKHLEDNCSHLLHAESRDKLIRFVLHRQTQVIINKLPDFIEYVMSNYYNERVRFTFYASKNLFSFAELINQIKKLLLNQFQNGNSIITKTNALEMLSHLITLEEFEEITKEYRPHIKKKEEKPNIDFLRIERLVPKMIKNITPSWKNFDLVYTYFDNDLFSSVLESYQKCCLHTRVDRLIPLLKACFEKSSKKSKIAVKKETIRMLLEVSNFQEALEHCKNYWDLIDHHSVRTLLFKKVSKSFLERPTEDIFQVFEKFIRECDEVIIEARPALNLIPKKFFTKYVLALWAFSESQEPSFRFGIQNEIISGFHPSNICSLSREFCEDLIKNNLFKNNLDVKKFTSYYVMLDGNEITSKLDFLIEIFKNQKVETNSISKFLNVLRLTSQENIEFSAKVFENLLIKWPFKTHMILYDDCLILKYYCIYHSIFNKVDDSNVNGKSEEFGRELKEFYSNYYNLNLLIPIFQQTLAVFLEEMKFNFKKFNALAAFKGMLQGSPNASIAILVILSIPNHITYLHKKEQTTFKPEEIIRKKELSDVTDLLSGYEDEVVQIYFERKFVSKYPIYD